MITTTSEREYDLVKPDIYLSFTTARLRAHSSGIMLVYKWLLTLTTESQNAFKRSNITSWSTSYARASIDIHWSFSIDQ